MEGKTRNDAGVWKEMVSLHSVIVVRWRLYNERGYPFESLAVAAFPFISKLTSR